MSRPSNSSARTFPRRRVLQGVGITVVGGHRYEASTIPDLQGKYVFGVWTTDPARSQPTGRILAATPPDDFGAGGGASTGTSTATEATTAASTTAESGGSADGSVPRDRLWKMEELVVPGGLGYFVRMFGQGADGQVYVLANEQGAPTGDTGVLLRLVPSMGGETETAGETETPGETGTAGETGTSAESPAGTPSNGETTGSNTPGFGLGSAVIAIFGGAALRFNRHNRDD